MQMANVSLRDVFEAGISEGRVWAMKEVAKETAALVMGNGRMFIR